MLSLEKVIKIRVKRDMKNITVLLVLAIALLVSNENYGMKRAVQEKDFEPSKEARTDDNGESRLADFWHILCVGDAEKLLAYKEFYSKDGVCTKVGNTPLIIAAFQGHYDCVKMILSYDIDVNARNIEGNTALICAASQGYTQIVDLLIKRGAQVNVQGGLENTPLMLAASAGDIETVQRLIAAGAEIDVWNEQGDTALMMALAEGHLAIAKILLDGIKSSWQRCTYINRVNNTGLSAFLIAGLNGHYDIMRQLTEMNTDVIVEGKIYRATLIMAAHRGKADLIKILNELDTGCYITEATFTEAFMIAIDAQHKEFVEEMMRQGININVRGQNNCTPLIWAVYTQRPDMVKLLLQYKPFLDAQDAGGSTALMWAVFVGNSEILRILINAGVHLNIQDKEGNTALMHAIIKDNREAAALLLEHNADVYITNTEQKDVFSLAAIHCSAAIHRLLVPHKNRLQAVVDEPAVPVPVQPVPMEFEEDIQPRVEAPFELPLQIEHYTPTLQENSPALKRKRHHYPQNKFLKAVCERNLKALERLTSKSIDVENPSVKRAFVEAVNIGDVEATKMFLKAGIDANATNQYNEPMLIIVLRSKNLEIASLLLDHGASVNKICAKGSLPLCVTAGMRWIEGIKLLIDRGADVTMSDGKGCTALMMAIHSDWWKKIPEKLILEIIAPLLEKGTPINVKNSEGRTALMMAAGRGSKEILSYLLERGADSNAQDENGNTTLMQIAEHSTSYIVSQENKDILTKYLLEYGADSYIKNNKGETVLMKAAETGSLELVKLFIEKGVDPHARSTEGLTALEYAAKALKKDCVQLLLKSSLQNTQSPEQLRILGVYAAQVGDCALLRDLLERGLDINEGIRAFWYNKQGDRLLYILEIAAGHGQKDIVEMLLNNSKLNIQMQGQFALVEAFSKGQKEIADMLIKAGITLKGQTEVGKSTLHKAAYAGHGEVIEKLQEAGVNVKSAGNKALLSAAESGKLSTVSALIKAGARLDINAKKHRCAKERISQRNDTVVQILEISQHPEVKQYLKNPQASLKRKYQRDEYGQTVLMWACMFGHVEHVQALLKLSLPQYYINAQDNYGYTALHYAFIIGNYTIVRMLAPYCSRGINLSDGKGVTILSYAIKREDIKLINDLLAAGARPTISDLKLAAQQERKDIFIKLLFFVARTDKNEKYPALFK